MTKPWSVLLVDDDEDDFCIVQDLLREVNAAVFWASSYALGLSRSCERAWDVCLVDCYLGAESGLDFMADTASLGCQFPVILLTGQGDRAVDDAAMGRGAADYLQKDGLTGEALQRSVRHAIERTRTLNTSQNFLQASLDALPAHICILGAEGQILAVNQSWSRFAVENGGDPHRCALGANYLEICERAVDCEDARRAARDIRAALNGDGTDPTFAYSCDSAAQRRWFAMRVSRFSNGEPCVVVSHENITPQKNAELSLQRSEARFRLAFESIPIGMVLLTREQRIWKSNQAFGSMLGYSDDQLLGRQLMDLVHPEDRNLLEGRIPTGGHPLRLLGSGGAVCWVKYTSVQVQVENDGESYQLGMVENKTQDLLRDEQLQQLQKTEEVARLAGGVAHDFNNIVTAIQGYADLILKELHASDPLRRDVEEINKASLRATALTRQLLAFSRKQILQPRVLNLNGVMEDMLRMLSRLIGEDVKITPDLAPDLRWARLDQGQFEQVVMNLVVNARDALPQGGNIGLHSSNLEIRPGGAAEYPELAPGPYVLVRITDNGQGMSADVQRHIFDPFYTTRTHGTGLGLSTVQGIVRQSGGTVLVESRLGQGSTFHLVFPAILAPVPEEAVATVELAVGHCSPRTVLVVEDDDMVRGLTCRVLRRAGYTVKEARGGAEAIQMCATQALRPTEEPISLVITDVVMPGLSGSQLAQRLHDMHPLLRFLYTSGYNDEAVLIRGITAQEVAFLPKPFTPDGLLQSVQAAVEGRIL